MQADVVKLVWLLCACVGCAGVPAASVAIHPPAAIHPTAEAVAVPPATTVDLGDFSVAVTGHVTTSRREFVWPAGVIDSESWAFDAHLRVDHEIQQHGRPGHEWLVELKTGAQEIVRLFVSPGHAYLVSTEAGSDGHAFSPGGQRCLDSFQ